MKATSLRAVWEILPFLCCSRIITPATYFFFLTSVISQARCPCFLLFWVWSSDLQYKYCSLLHVIPLSLGLLALIIKTFVSNSAGSTSGSGFHCLLIGTDSGSSLWNLSFPLRNQSWVLIGQWRCLTLALEGKKKKKTKPGFPIYIFSFILWPDCS